MMWVATRKIDQGALANLSHKLGVISLFSIEDWKKTGFNSNCGGLSSTQLFPVFDAIPALSTSRSWNLNKYWRFAIFLSITD
jgi:hypothetical protein